MNILIKYLIYLVLNIVCWYFIWHFYEKYKIYDFCKDRLLIGFWIIVLCFIVKYFNF